MLLRTLKMSFWVVYDHLGKLLIANMLGACCIIIPMLAALKAFETGDFQQIVWFALPVSVMTLMFVIPVVQVGMLWMIKEIIEKREGSLKTFFDGIRIFGVRAAGLGFVYMFCSMCLLTSVWFYGGRIGAITPFLGYGLSAIAVWAFIFLMVSSLLALPALVNKNAGIANAMKMATVLEIDNPVFMAGVTAHFVALLALCVMPPVFFCFSFAPLAALQGSAYEIMSRKYAAITAHAESTGILDKSIAIDFGDENDEYLCRGFRDMLFPWKE